MSRWVPRIRRDVFCATLLVALAFVRTAAAHDEYLATLVRKARAEKLARSRTWQVLLHYRPMWYGGWRSEADGPGFFKAGPIGKIDPERELVATLAAFRSPAVPFDPARLEESQHPQCRFPARWTFLKQALGIDTTRFVEQPCPIYARWRQAMAAEKVSLVYASAYLNSPASMYGHTFFRISRATGEGNPLLDYIINFAADVDTDNGLLFAVKGIAGGFKGHFYTMPYYVKIQEYSNMESRDLWEYELALTPEQIERLVAHAWETRTTHFDYFFLSENCSYFLLGLLEAGVPELHLEDRFNGSVIPSDTVRAVLAVPGLVRSVAPRPSLHAVMMSRKAQLGGSETHAADALAADGKLSAPLLAGLVPARQAAVVDAAYDRLRYKEGGKEPPTATFARTERDLLVLRGRTGVPPQPLLVEPSVDAPERGHRTLRMSAGGGVSQKSAGAAASGFEELAFRVAIHDHLDPPRGYVSDAVLEMGNVRLRFDNDRRSVELERADLIHIVSPAPLDSWAPKLSWSARIGGQQLHALGCEGWGCLAGGASAGGGLATKLGRALLLYGLVESELEAGGPLEDHYHIGLGGSAAAVLRVGSFWNVQLGGRYIAYFLGDPRRPLSALVGQSFSLGRRAQLRAVGEVAGRYREARLEAVAYF
jgi:hypothetical protein